MLKLELDHIKNRVASVIRCTNGNIFTNMEKRKKETALTVQDKMEQIRKGVAVLKSDADLDELRAGYGIAGVGFLCECFNFQETKEQVEAKKYNQRIDDAIVDMHLQVELAGKRLIDDVVLGLCDKKEVPNRLEKLSTMFLNDALDF